MRRSMRRSGRRRRRISGEFGVELRSDGVVSRVIRMNRIAVHILVDFVAVIKRRLEIDESSIDVFCDSPHSNRKLYVDDVGICPLRARFEVRDWNENDPLFNVIEIEIFDECFVLFYEQIARKVVPKSILRVVRAEAYDDDVRFALLRVLPLLGISVRVLRIGQGASRLAKIAH